MVTEQFVIMFTRAGRPTFECMLYDSRDGTYTPVPIAREGERSQRGQESPAWEAYQLIRAAREMRIG